MSDLQDVLGVQYGAAAETLLEFLLRFCVHVPGGVGGGCKIEHLRVDPDGHSPSFLQDFQGDGLQILSGYGAQDRAANVMRAGRGLQAGNLLPDPADLPEELVDPVGSLADERLCAILHRLVVAAENLRELGCRAVAQTDFERFRGEQL